MSSPAVIAAANAPPALGAADLSRLHAIATLAREAGHAAVEALLAEDGMEEDEEGVFLQGLHIPHDLYDVQDAYTHAYEQVCHHYHGERVMYTAYLAALSDPLVFTFADEHDNLRADWPRRICNEVLGLHAGHEVAIRGMPVWALNMALAQFEWRRDNGMPYPPHHDPEFELPNTRIQHEHQKDEEARMETRVELELAQRHHNYGRTAYLQSNAALWVEGWVTRVAPGMNPRPVQTLIANFLSLSFNGRNEVIPRYPAAPAPRRSKRGHGDGDDDDKSQKPRLGEK